MARIGRLLDADDKENLRLVAWKEARGEQHAVLAMTAVMKMCLHRVGHPGFAKTLHDVIYGKNQFSSMSVPSDPEYNLKPLDTDPSWQATAPLVEMIETCVDPIPGALFYDNPKTAEKGGWFERNIAGLDGKGLPGHSLIAIIDHHSFYA